MARRNSPRGFKLAEHDNGITQIADIERGLHMTHEPMLRKDEDGHNAELVEVVQSSYIWSTRKRSSGIAFR